MKFMRKLVSQRCTLMDVMADIVETQSQFIRGPMYNTLIKFASVSQAGRCITITVARRTAPSAGRETVNPQPIGFSRPVS